MQIIDNFFTDPYKIRKEALDIKKWNCNYRYPGYRQDVSESLASKYLYQIRSILNEDVKVDDPRENIRFQFMDKSWGRGLVHFDKAKYTVLTFLTPSANGVNSKPFKIFNNLDESTSFLNWPSGFLLS